MKPAPGPEVVVEVVVEMVVGVVVDPGSIMPIACTPGSNTEVGRDISSALSAW